MPNKPDDNQLQLPQLIDLDTVSRHLGVSQRHVRRLVFERRIPYLKWGSRVMFDQQEIAAWIDAARRPPEAA